jgi:hypothetical protein
LFVEEIQPKIVAGSQLMLEIGQRLKAIERLGDAQYVCWDYMSQEFVEDVLAAPNVNSFLRQYMIRDRFKKVEDTISKTASSTQITPFARLYLQSVEAFREKKNDLAVVGFTAVFDGLLSVVSENSTHKLKYRIKVIKDKLNNEKALSHEEYAMIAFMMTFDKTMDSFSADSDFKNKEPKGLNRHWIAHGRTLRKKTKLDCVKMLNMIYGLILVSNLELINHRS